LVQYSEQIFYTTNSLILCQEFPCRSRTPAPSLLSNARSTSSKLRPTAATDSPTRKSAASWAFPKAPPATFFELSSGAATCAAKRKAAVTGLACKFSVSAATPRPISISPTRSEEHTSELQSLAYLVC